MRPNDAISDATNDATNDDVIDDVTKRCEQSLTLDEENFGLIFRTQKGNRWIWVSALFFEDLDVIN